jgi:hypothetical protein
LIEGEASGEPASFDVAAFKQRMLAPRHPTPAAPRSGCGPASARRYSRAR